MYRVHFNGKAQKISGEQTGWCPLLSLSHVTIFVASRNMFLGVHWVHVATGQQEAVEVIASRVGPGGQARRRLGGSLLTRWTLSREHGCVLAPYDW